nr:hypothetical protein [Tanacetum cinerariifolium]
MYSYNHFGCSCCGGPFNGRNCLGCSSVGSGNEFVYDPNLNSFDNPLDFSYQSPQPQYETYSCELCGNDAHYGYDCPLQVPLVLFKSRLSMSRNRVTIKIMFPVIHQPPQETSVEILHDQENVINSVQTFLRKFNRCSFFKTPKVLLLALDRVSEIKDAFRNKQYKLEDIQELFRKLFNDVQNIHEELAEYINTLSWDRSIVYYDDDDDDEDYTIAITPDFLITDSLSMGDEYLSTILETEPDELIKSSVENIVPNPSESEDLSNIRSECNVPVGNDFTTFSNSLFDADDNFSSSDDESFSDKDVPKEIYSNPLFDEEIISVGLYYPVAPTTAEQRLARKNELKARGTLLMALPDKHQLKFNTHKDAKTLITNAPVSAPASVSAVSAKIPVSALPNVDSLSNAVIYLFFTSQSNSLQLDNDDLKQIDADDLEEMDLKWQMAMLTVRARQFLQRTGRNLRENGPTSIGFDMSKVECYNCHRKGHFAKECRSPKDTRRNAMTRVFKQKRKLPTMLLWPSLLQVLLLTMRKSQYDVISYQTGLESVEARLLVYQQNESVFEEDIKLLKLEPTEQVKSPRSSVQHVETSIPTANPKTAIPKPTSNGKRRNRKECFVCKILDHLIKDCDYHEKKMAQTTARNHAKRHVVLAAVLTQSKLVPITDVRPVTTAVPKTSVTRPRQAKTIVTKPNLPPRRHIKCSPSPKASNFPPKVTAVKAPMVNAAQGNMSYLSDFEELNGGYVFFGGNQKDGKISRKGKIRTGKLDFDDVYFVKELKFNLFSVSQICDKKNSVLFTDTECLVLSPDFKLPDENQVLLRVPKENNMYNVDLKNIVPSGDLTCLFAKAPLDESTLWHRRLGHFNFKTMNKLGKGNLVRGLPSKVFENDHTCVACKKGKQHRASCKTKPVSFVNQPLQRLHMDLFGPTFVKSLNKKSYCLVVTDDYRLKREFSVPKTPQQNGIAERKNRTLIEAARTMMADLLLPIPFWAEAVNTTCYVQNRVLVTKPHNKTPYELLHGRTPSSGPTWLFDIDTLTKTMNYQPVTVGNQSNPSAGIQEQINAEKAGKEIVQQYVLFLVWSSGSINPQNTDGDVAFDEKELEYEGRKLESEVNVSSNKLEDFSDNSINEDNVAGSLVHDVGQLSPNSTNTFSATELEDITYSDDEDDVGAEADFNNMETSITVSPIPTTRVHKDHPVTQIIGDLSSAIQTRSMTRVAKDQRGLSQINKDDFYTCMFACFLSQEEPKRVHQALKDPSWIEAMQEELLQFKMEKVWVLVDLPHAKRAICTKCCKDRSYKIVLAYASFMGFMVYQMDVKSAFLYGTIEEEVYVCQPPGNEDPGYPNKVYKVVKALYGLHQASRAWYETLDNYLLENGFQRGKIDQTLFIKRQKDDILVVQIYVDDIIFVKQKKDGIFISHDIYVDEILRKFGLTEGKSASTPIDPEKTLLKDHDGEDVDVHTYRSMIGLLMYLTSSRPDIMFAVCACARFQVTPKASHLHAVKRTFRYLKGKPHLGLWYSKDSPFDLVAYSYSDYAGVSLNRKSTTGGCQFFICRLISWQCKKQTVMATSSTEAEYVDAASCCAQVLWIQNQLLDYRYILLDCIFLGFGLTMQVVLSGMESLKRMLHVTYILSAGYLTIPQMVLNSPCLSHIKNWLVHIKRSLSWLVQKQTSLGKDKANPLIVYSKLYDKKKVIITKATIRDALRLDDAEGIECLSNEEIFAELARMGYEKPSTKLTFYKVFFSSRKFNFSKYIFDSLVRNVESSTKFYMYPCFLQLMIRAQVGDLSSYTIKYTSPALTQKVFANIKRVGKGFFGVETSLFEGMIVEQQVGEGAAEVHVEDVSTAGVADEGDVSAADDDKIAQALEITKLKQRVKKLERRNKASKLKRLKKVSSAQRIDTSDDTVMDDVSKQGRMIADMDADVDLTLKDIVADAKDGQDAEMEESADVLSMQDDEVEPTELKEVVEVVTTAKLITEVVTIASATITTAAPQLTIAAAPTLTTARSTARKRKGILIRDPKETATPSTIIHSEAKSKDKGKGILLEEPKPLKKQAQIEQDEDYAREKNMMIYLRNVVGFKMDYFKGMAYDDIRPIIEKKINSNVAFLLKIKEQKDEEDSRALKRLSESQDDKTAKKQKLDEEVEELKRHL